MSNSSPMLLKPQNGYHFTSLLRKPRQGVSESTANSVDMMGDILVEILRLMKNRLGSEVNIVTDNFVLVAPANYEVRTFDWCFFFLT